MERPERPFFFAAAGVFAVNIALLFVGVPVTLRTFLFICALVLILVGLRRRDRQFR
jgi:Flp pilus assembly protein TadB